MGDRAHIPLLSELRAWDSSVVYTDWLERVRPSLLSAREALVASVNSPHLTALNHQPEVERHASVNSAIIDAS